MVKKVLKVACCAMLLVALLCGCWGRDDSSSSQAISGSATPTPSASSEKPGSMGDSTGLAGSEFGGGSSSGSLAGSGVTSGETLPDSGSSMPGATMKPTVNASWNLTLVNAENPLSGDFSVLVRSVKGYSDREFDQRAADELEAMLADAEAAGNKLYLVSSYRSVKRQAALYQRKVNWYLEKGYAPELARTEATKWVAAPGTSEHNLGLAADIVSATWYGSHDDLTEEFETTPEFAWLSAHCTQYGFVLRYPKGKTALTGVEYEPWHYRYVGREAAEYLTQNGLCLEEL